jgi:two-component system cell cycle sensor histidine kinase/response regulator CckA
MPEPPSQAVLVVEGDPAVQRMLAAAFHRWGVTAHFAGTGPEALDLYRQHAATIGLALLEVNLPEMDGPTTLNGLRTIRPDLRCWFLGGAGGGYTQRELLDCGAEGLLHKPFDLQMLRSLLGPIVGETP